MPGTASETWPPARSHLVTVAQFQEMTRVGILTKYDKVELIEGHLIAKKPRTPPHLVTSHLIQRAIQSATPPDYLVVTAFPVTLARSELEPGVMVLRGPIDTYARRRPGPADTPLLAEVADESLDEDRSRGRLYAEVGVPIYWIANIPDRRIEVYSDPAGNEYRARRDYRMEEQLPVILDGRKVTRLAVSDLLPPPTGG